MNSMLVRLFCFESVGVGYIFDLLIPEVRTATGPKESSSELSNVTCYSLVGYFDSLGACAIFGRRTNSDGKAFLISVD